MGMWVVRARPRVKVVMDYMLKNVGLRIQFDNSEDRSIAITAFYGM